MAPKNRGRGGGAPASPAAAPGTTTTGTPTPVTPPPGYIYPVPILAESLTPTPRETYQKDLANLLKQIAESNQEPKSEEYQRNNIGSFSLLPTYSKKDARSGKYEYNQEEGILGGSSFEEIREALEARKLELTGDHHKYTKGKEVYGQQSAEIERLQKEIAKKEKILEENRLTMSNAIIDKMMEEIAEIKNNLLANQEARRKQRDYIDKQLGFIPKMEAMLAETSVSDPDSPKIAELRGRITAAKAELTLIQKGFEILPKLSRTLSEGPKDASFAEKGTRVGEISSGSVLRNTLEIATTQMTKEALRTHRVGGEIKTPYERLDKAKVRINGLIEQVKRLREQLTGVMPTVLPPKERERIRRVLANIAELSNYRDDDGNDLVSEEVGKDVLFLSDFLLEEEQRAFDREQEHPLEVGGDGRVLRSLPPTTRLPGETHFSVNNITMTDPSPLKSLKGIQNIYGYGAVEVFQAWKRDFIDSGKVDTYREASGTKNLWESKESEAQQIATTKELYALYLELLPLKDYLPGTLADSLASNLQIFAKILCGVHDDEKHNIKWNIKHYSHEQTLKEIALRKGQLAAAQEEKKRDELGSMYTAVTTAPKAPPVANILAQLQESKEWQKELVDIDKDALEERRDDWREKLNTYKNQLQQRMEGAAWMGDLQRMEAILFGIEEYKAWLQSPTGGLTPELESLKELWVRYCSLFKDLSDENIKTLGESKAHAIRVFKLEEPSVAKLFTDMTKLMEDGAAFYAAAEKQVIAARTALERNILHPYFEKNIKPMIEAREPITTETLTAHGVQQQHIPDILRIISRYTQN